MNTNRALNFLALGVGMLLLPVQFVTTFLTGILTVITFGLFMLVLDLVWNIAFLWPLLGTSWLWLRLPWLRLLVVVVGFPHALLAGAYCTLVGSAGDFNARRQKMRIAYTWPYSYDYFRLVLGKSVSQPQQEDVARALVNVGV